LIDRQAASGQNVAAFCQQASVSAPGFYFWKRKLKQRDAQAATRERPVARDSRELPGVQIVPVHIESSSGSPIRILLPQGVSVEVTSEIAANTVTSLLRAVREAHAC
jgi:hypothetical protein